MKWMRPKWSCTLVEMLCDATVRYHSSKLIVEVRTLKADAVSKLIEASNGQEQALYVLLAAKDGTAFQRFRRKP
jgi:hypothetical protein